MRRLILFLPLLAFSKLWAQNYVLDPTFGNNGAVVTSFANGIHNFVNSIAMQPDGKIVACGHTQQSSAPFTHQIGIVRYNANGSLDQGFGTGGKIILDPGPNTSDRSYVRIAPDGKIYVLGTSQKILYDPDRFILARYNPDGTPDATFGNGGVLIMDDTGYAFGIEILDDGKLIIVGNIVVNGQEDFGIFKFHPNGGRDLSFGIEGKTIVNFGTILEPNLESLDMPMHFKILDNGKILIGGVTNANEFFQGFRFALAQLNSNGTIDASFGVNGRVITVFDEFAQINTVMVNDQHEIYALGYWFGMNPQTGHVAMAKYDASGNLDTSFGIGGKVESIINTPGNFGLLNNGLLTNDGKILAVGTQELDAGTLTNTQLAQYNADGSLDENFGTDGLAFYDLDPNYDGMLNMIHHHGDKILTGGFIGDNFGLARFAKQTLGVSIHNPSSAFSIYPNPANETIFIQNPNHTPIDTISIVDMTGKKVIEQQLDGHSLNTSRLQSGVYLIQIHASGHTQSYKFIKQ